MFRKFEDLVDVCKSDLIFAFQSIIFLFGGFLTLLFAAILPNAEFMLISAPISISIFIWGISGIVHKKIIMGNGYDWWILKESKAVYGGIGLILFSLIPFIFNFFG